MALEKQANCKECGLPYTYSYEWSEALEAEGRQPTEYCPRCRTIHGMERGSVGMPYFKPKPTGPRKPDKMLTAGQLGRLTHVDRQHRTVNVPARFQQPGSDIDFGIKDPDIIDLIKEVQQRQVTVVVGPTGSGKSTFVPYRLIAPPPPFPTDLFTRYGQVIVTQPRIQAARTISDFVARDLHGCTLGAGGDVGYIHRGEKAADDHAKLVYCTDGSLINWIISGKIANFSIIMIDEAHERSLNIDVILGLLKMRLPLYPNLKLIIASATIDSDLFRKHFGGLQKVSFKNFEGLKKFSYKRAWRDPKDKLSERGDEMASGAVSEVLRVLRGIASGRQPDCEKPGGTEPSPEGDVLVFLPTVPLIEKAAGILRERIKDDLVLSERGIQVHELHRKVPLEAQNLTLQKKSQAVTDQVFRILISITKGESPNGDLLVLLPDEKSAEDALKKIESLVKENPPFAGTGLSLLSGRPVAPDGNEAPARWIRVATHDQATDQLTGKFQYIVYDRRVVIATNIAETSLTVDGIVYVIDSGLIMHKGWDLDTFTEEFKNDWHSQDGVKQRWGRAGRVRDGWVYCLYTEKQYQKFEAHTVPEIQRAPLEAVVLQAKRAGIDDVFTFPWIQPPAQKELERAVEVLQDRGLLDEDGDLTEHGGLVGQYTGTPNIGHWLVLADQMACAMEVATLAAMLDHHLKGDLVRWQHQWDGHTRWHARKIQRSLAWGCRDDVAFLLKLFQAWSEAWKPDYNWLTDAAFEQTWSVRIPAVTQELLKKIGEAAAGELVSNTRLARQRDDLWRIADHLLPDPLVESWLKQAEIAMRDARRAAWAVRFFVSHLAMAKVDAARQEILDKLSIGKKKVNTRPLSFDRILNRVRLVTAYAWPDQIVVKKGSSYKRWKPRNVSQPDFEISIDRDSVCSWQPGQPEAFVAAKMRALKPRGETRLAMGFLAVLDPGWLSSLRLPIIEFVQWAANELDTSEKALPESRQIFVDQLFPLFGRFECHPSQRTFKDHTLAKIGERLAPPRFISETTIDGEILYSDDAVGGIGDLDDKVGAPQELAPTFAPEEPEHSQPDDLLESSEGALLFASSGGSLPDLDIYLNGLKVFPRLSAGSVTEFSRLPEDEYVIRLGPADKPEETLFEQTLSVEGGQLACIVIAQDATGTRLRPYFSQARSELKQQASVRLINASARVGRVRLHAGNLRTEQSIPFLEYSAPLRLPAGRMNFQVAAEDGLTLATLEEELTPGQDFTIAFVTTPKGQEMLAWKMPLIDALATLPRLFSDTDSPAPVPELTEAEGVIPSRQNLTASFPAEITGAMHDEAGVFLLNLQHSPRPGPFENFCSRHQRGDRVTVVTLALEQEPPDKQVSLIVRVLDEAVPDLDLTVVMEAGQLNFAARYALVEAVEPGLEFEAVIEAISAAKDRIYLSTLPILESFLPESGAICDATATEIIQGSGIHVTLNIPGLTAIPLSAYVEEEDIPSSIKNELEGMSFKVRVEYEDIHDKKMTAPSTALRELLDAPERQGQIGWDPQNGKLWIRGRMIYAERERLLAAAGDSYARRVIDDLYRFSNTLIGRPYFAEKLQEFARAHEIGSVVTAEVIKVYKQDIRVAVGDCVFARVSLAEARRALNHRIDAGMTVDVRLKAIKFKAGEVDVSVVSKTEMLQQKYSPGSLHTGKVVRIEEYGVFIELEKMLNGMCHRSQAGWGKVVDLRQMYRIGDPVSARVVKVHPDGKIELNMKIDENRPEKRFKAGDIVQGEVVHVINTAGALVRLEPGLIGLIHMTELSWTKIERVAQFVSPGQKVTTRVIASSSEPFKINLSMKAAYAARFGIAGKGKGRLDELIGERGKIINVIQAETDTHIVATGDVIRIQGSSRHKVLQAQQRVESILPGLHDIDGFLKPQSGGEDRYPKL